MIPQSTEPRHVYAREYAAARRCGCSTEISSARARRAVERVTGKTANARKSGNVHDVGGAPQPHKIVIPPDRLADAERIRHLDHETITGRLMGDPLPGRSALDQRKG